MLDSSLDEALSDEPADRQAEQGQQAQRQMVEVS
jgi:hypothetical protein